MNGKMGWVFAAIVLIAAAAYFFWPASTTAPVVTEGAPEQTGGVQENIGDPAMNGMWQSTTDAKFTREIRPDGVMIDRYEGDVGAGTGGQWSTSDAAGAAADNVTVPANLASLPIIKVVWAGGVETTYFAVNKLTADSMTTTDLTGRGAVTVYKKVVVTP